MGRRNAEAALRKALRESRPALVLSSGFAGGLDPGLARGDVVFADDGQPEIAAALVSAGARKVRFACVNRVAAGAPEKRALRLASGADAVEMESEALGAVCREAAIPFATVRVILDTAGEDLPLDFGSLMTADERLDYGKLAWKLIRSPGKISGLMRLQKQSRSAAEVLARVLMKVTAGR
jgi:nucleoside phosphorylase